MMNFVNYIPIATSVFSAYFFIQLLLHWLKDTSSIYLLWWMLGIFFYGAGTATESIHATMGYMPANFKAWYIFGALLGAAPLAQGTVHLLLKTKFSDFLSYVLILTIIVVSVLVIRSPLVPGEHDKLGGYILKWSYIRYITPFINVYALIFLVGGAVYSAILYARKGLYKKRMWGNILIAIGCLLGGIGGAGAKAGYIEVLYITEFVGILFIYAGYLMVKLSSEESIHPNQSDAIA
ncbi:MAG: hypothetical protein R2800_05425 [Flavipsychrobacter sp.]